jgi:endonuclease YncB( thermonuclease family)
VFRARLLGFDTPEKKSRCVAEARDAVTATWLLRKSIWEAEEMQVQLKGTDRYGRRLVRMFLDGRDVADIMIATGYARRYGGGRRGSWCP